VPDPTLWRIESGIRFAEPLAEGLRGGGAQKIEIEDARFGRGDAHGFGMAALPFSALLGGGFGFCFCSGSVTKSSSPCRATGCNGEGGGSTCS